MTPVARSVLCTYTKQGYNKRRFSATVCAVCAIVCLAQVAVSQASRPAAVRGTESGSSQGSNRSMFQHSCKLLSSDAKKERRWPSPVGCRAGQPLSSSTCTSPWGRNPHSVRYDHPTAVSCWACCPPCHLARQLPLQAQRPPRHRDHQGSCVMLGMLPTLSPCPSRPLNAHPTRPAGHHAQTP